MDAITGAGPGGAVSANNTGLSGDVFELDRAWIITPGDRTIARLAASARARRVHAQESHKRFLNDPLIRARGQALLTSLAILNRKGDLVESVACLAVSEVVADRGRCAELLRDCVHSEFVNRATIFEAVDDRHDRKSVSHIDSGHVVKLAADAEISSVAELAAARKGCSL